MRIPIRTKLAAALAVPLVALVGGAAYEVVQAGNEADAAAAVSAAVETETDLATAAVGPGSLISTLQLERNISGVEQLGLQDALVLPVANSAEARAATDAAAEELRAFVAGSDQQVADAFSGAVAAIDQLQVLRDQIDQTTTTPGLDNSQFANEVFLAYTGVIEALLDSTAGVAIGVDDAELRTGVEMVALATRAYELRSTIVSRIILPTLVQDTSTAARTTVASLVARSDQVDEDMLARSTGAYEGLAEAAILSEQVLGQDALFDTYVADGTADLPALIEQVSSSGETGYIALRQQAADALGATAAALQTRAATVQADAEDHQQLVLLFAGAAVLLALVVGAFASRSITKPLRSLTDQAQAMADEHLPHAVQQVLDTPLGDDVVVPELAPVHVKTRDEVADVAVALTTVQGAALDLAVEQAVLRRNIADSFVNMSRRNQNLLDRQLGAITDLEREEADPDRLEGLFRLDHLATRMRRNAESLLRLAGGGSGATAGWSGPVPIGDLVRAALGEVEDYQRVDVKALEAVTVSGSAGTDVAHALAELIENALAFSPPEERVEVRGRRTDDGYVLAVVDNGVGMTAEQLAIANRRLAGQESFTVAPSRYLGHYVAGHLATTHGIDIALQATPAGGITARIDLPQSVLTLVAPVAPVAEAPVAPAPVPAPAAVAVAVPEPEAVPFAAAPPPVPPGSALSNLAPASSTGSYDDLASWLVPAPADASSITDPEPDPEPDLEPDLDLDLDPDPVPVSPPVAIAVPLPAETETGFGGLAVRDPGAPADASTTASGLTKRVRGAQETAMASFASPLGPLGPLAPPVEDAPAAAPATAEQVGDFFSSFSSGVERGLADADEARETDSSEWGTW